jgi:hypothetical protein
LYDSARQENGKEKNGETGDKKKKSARENIETEKRDRY